MAQASSVAETVPEQVNSDENERKKLAALYLRSASSPSKLETQTRGSMSPVASEANASIDLNCDSPASASIDISDHNLKPTDRIASVLHLKGNERGATGAQLSQRQPEAPKIIGGQEEEGQVTSLEAHESQAATLGTPDSLADSEEAAAIRIQSAFRGYRTRKNSPYRTRSPTSSPASLKRNALRQQEAAVLVEEEADQAARSEGRRSSRARQRAGSSTDEQTGDADGKGADQTVEDSPGQVEPLEGVASALSLDEFSNADTTVKELVGVLDQQDEQSAALIGSNDSSDGTGNNDNSNHVEAIPNQVSQIQMGRNGIQLPATPSLSLDIGESAATSTARDELPSNLSAALELAPPSSNINDEPDQLDAGFSLPASGTRRSAGSGDTDSSVLGAALSEEMSEELSPLSPPQQQQCPIAFQRIDGDRLPGDLSAATLDELDLEAQRLVDELTGAEQSFAGLSSAASESNQLEAALEDASTTANESVLLNEEEQRTIELESDDIERRDPRGQVSEERAKSPQIVEAGEVLDFNLAESNSELDGSQPVVASLGVEQPGEGAAAVRLLHLDESGRSSPAFNSSGCGTSSDSDRNDLEDLEGVQKKLEPQQPANSSTGRNKKRNRNKKKGKK